MAVSRNGVNMLVPRKRIPEANTVRRNESFMRSMLLRVWNS